MFFFRVDRKTADRLGTLYVLGLRHKRVTILSAGLFFIYVMLFFASSCLCLCMNFACLRLLRYNKPLLKLTTTLRFALFPALKVLFLLFASLNVYALVGMEMFSRLQPNGPATMDRHVNFTTWLLTMSTLFRSMTGENWNLLMRDCMIQAPFCDDAAGQCGWPVGAIIFWVSFQFINYYFLSNLFIAIILEEFEEEARADATRGRADTLDLADIDAFATLWSQLEPSHMLLVSRLPELLHRLPSDLRLNHPISKQLELLNVPSQGSHVHYLDVLYRICWLAFTKIAVTRKINIFHEMCALVRTQALALPDLADRAQWGYRCTLVHYAVLIQRMWRGHRVRRTFVRLVIGVKRKLDSASEAMIPPIAATGSNSDSDVDLGLVDVVGRSDILPTQMPQVRDVEREGKK
jgi:hypothetical protein